MIGKAIINLKVPMTTLGKFKSRINSVKVVKSNGRTANPIPPNNNAKNFHFVGIYSNFVF
jgi:hypothetical protein